MNNLKSKKINLERFFQAKGGSHLFGTIYATVYQDMHPFVFMSNNMLTMFLDHKAILETRALGHELWLNLLYSQKHEEIFLDYLDNVNIALENSLLISSPRQCASEVFATIINFLQLYRTTESFYTEEIFSSKINHLQLRKTQKTIEHLKTSGRRQVNVIFNGHQAILSRLVSRLSSDFGQPTKLIWLHDWADLKSGYIDSKLTRPSDYAITTSLNGARIIDKTSQTFIEISRELHNVAGTFVHGLSAYPGLITGSARVLVPNFTNYDELDTLLKQMLEGEILITETTSPELLLACTKAAAIVTNQGGLGSHAATISRELKIPCIVGTKNATHVFSTGQKITVDANRGIVTLATS